jgi:adenine-specific DNA-methyltransferase
VSVRLDWEGKPKQVEHVSLPFQAVETINVSRATRERDSGALFGGSSAADSERNLLVWGDNKLVLGSLLTEFAGQVDLIYIDPPFATGADFSHHVNVGDVGWVKAPSILEEHAYRDTWGAGYASYLTMLFERLALLRDLLSSTGSIYVHLDWRAAHFGKMILDELFGPMNFKNEIIWRRANTHNDPDGYGRIHDTLLYYRRPGGTFNRVHGEYRQEYLDQAYRHVDPDGRRYRLLPLHATHVFSSKDDNTRRFGDKVLRPPPGKYWRWSQTKIDEALAGDLIVLSKNDVPQYKKYLDEAEGVPVQSIWDDLKMLGRAEMLGYPTQKPESLLERIITASSNEGDLVLDCFVGSGTTAAVAEKLSRRWIGCDLGRFAIHTTRKRLLNVPDCRPFDIKNLGAYERQRWQQSSGNGALRDYFATILAFYRGDPVDGFISLHGRKAGRMVHIGATDAPVTIDEAEEVMDEMADNGMEACDVLGWEWEMGLHDTVPERARRRGLDLQLRQIPREVMERQVAEADAVRFFELAHVDLDVRRQEQEAAVVLKDFIIPSEDLIPPKVRERIENWSDLIDYWSVDFDHRDETFHNQWQAYRTREEPKLATESDWHEYPEPGRYAIVVKIIDIFGNDTTKLAEVRIK